MIEKHEKTEESFQTRRRSSRLDFFTGRSNQSNIKIVPAKEKEDTDDEEDADIIKKKEGASKDTIDTLLFQRLITIFSAVLDSAAMSNNWILIDRTNEQSSPTAELLLELAMQRNHSSKARPIILVIDSIDRLSRFHSNKAKEQVKHLQKLEKVAQPFGTDIIQERFHLDIISQAQDFSDWRSFIDLPLPCVPQKQHIRDNGISDKRKWMYHYSETIYGSGTHYIFLGSNDDSFPIEALQAPIGTVCAHGGSAAYGRLRSTILSGQPLVMLANTGGVTQAFSSCHRAILERSKSKESNNSTCDILSKIEIVSNENWAKHFGIAEIMFMLELHERAPLLFKKTIVAVDLIESSAEEVLSILTGCFSSIDGGIPELGLGSAETSCVLNAWQLYLLLKHSASQFYFYGLCLYWILLLLNVLTSLASTIYASSNKYATKNMNTDVLRNIIVILPVLSTFIATTRVRSRNIDKASICNTGAAYILSEIYYFRTRTGLYDSSIIHKTTNDFDKVQKSTTSPRAIFVQEIQRIFSAIIDSDVGNSSTLATTKKQHDQEAGLHSQFYAHLKQYVTENEPTLTPIENLDTTMNDNNTTIFPFQKHSDAFDVVEDDLVTPLSIESYIQCRAKPTAHYFQKCAPRLSSALSLLELLTNIVTSAGALLALINRAELVSFTVALAVAISNIIEFFALRPQLDTANAAVRDVQNMLSWFCAQSLVDRRTRTAKQHAVRVVEQAILGFYGSQPGTDAPFAIASDPATKATTGTKSTTPLPESGGTLPIQNVNNTGENTSSRKEPSSSSSSHPYSNIVK
uniref:Uncharacterized protein n=1 Tax=Aureoumbra lagunensis TaxID=44058 RepID=A0A7S3JU93_9STRA